MAKGNVFLKQNFQYFDKLDPDKTYTSGWGSTSRQLGEADRRLHGALSTTAEDSEGNFYVLSVYRDRRETGHAEFINDGFMATRTCRLVICENNQFQSTLVQEVLKDYPRIPIEGASPTSTR
jgi:hypothetical protein